MRNKKGIKILAIGNSEDFFKTISLSLNQKNFSLQKRLQGVSALKEALTNKYQIIIIELGSSRRANLFEGIKFFKKAGLSAPVLLTYKYLTQEEEIEACKSGVDIFHKKPIKPLLLETQVEKLLKEHYIIENISIKNLYIKPKERRLFLNKKEIKLTVTEYNFLLLLIKHNGKVLTRNQIIRNILNYNREVCPCAVDTMISRIRKKLGKYRNKIIETVPKTGYRLGEEYIREKK